VVSSLNIPNIRLVLPHRRQECCQPPLPLNIARGDGCLRGPMNTPSARAVSGGPPSKRWGGAISFSPIVQRASSQCDGLCLSCVAFLGQVFVRGSMTGQLISPPGPQRISQPMRLVGLAVGGAVHRDPKGSTTLSTLLDTPPRRGACRRAPTCRAANESSDLGFSDPPLRLETIGSDFFARSLEQARRGADRISRRRPARACVVCREERDPAQGSCRRGAAPSR